MFKSSLFILLISLVACKSISNPNSETSIASPILDKATMIQKIDEYVLPMKAEENWTKVTESQLMGGGRFFYYKGKDLVLIKASMLGSAMTLDTDFYIHNNALVFVEQTRKDYRKTNPIDGTKPYTEYSKMYMQNNTIFEYIHEGSEDAKADNLESFSQQLIHDFEVFSKEAKSATKVNNK